jgi:hypothetical protein
MTDDLGTGGLSSPVTNGATGDSASAISVRSIGGAKAIDGSDEKALSAVTFLVAEINRLAEEISVRSNGDAKAIDGSDEKVLSTVTFLAAEINRLAEENRQLHTREQLIDADLQRFKDKYHDLEKRLAVLKETIKPFRTNEFLSSVCLIAGSAGVGAAPSYLSLNSYGWYVFIGMSALLVIAGIVARVQSGLSSKQT